LQARLKLQLDEGQMYHPKNACKLFLGYRFEKTKNGDIKNYIPITEKNYRKLVSTYNGCGGSGCDDYETKLKTTYTYVLDKLDIKTANRSQTTKLKGKSFEFV
jgi:hypothetical protein